MNKSTLSANHNKYHSLNTLKDHGLAISHKALTLQFDQENIEEMHHIMVAFHRTTHTLLIKLEDKMQSVKSITSQPKGSKNEVLITECTEDVFL